MSAKWRHALRTFDIGGCLGGNLVARRWFKHNFLSLLSVVLVRDKLEDALRVATLDSDP